MRRTDQRGFAMLEVMLAIACSAWWPVA